MTKDESSRRVVITGIGICSPIGTDVETFWDNLSAGKSGVGPIELMSHSAAPENVGGEVHGFNDKVPKGSLPKKQRKFVRVMCREIQLGVVSALQAVENSQLDIESIDNTRFGVGFGANLMFSPPDALQDACWKCVEKEGVASDFVYDEWGEKGLPAMEPLWLLRYLPNMPACHIGIAVDARGPNNSLTLDEASGNLALGEAFHVIRRGAADMMIAGTTGTRLHPVKTIHAHMWDSLAQYDTPPETWCRPFDESRSGQVVAEGSASFILEDAEHAKERDGQIIATILGLGSSCVIDRSGKANPRKALAQAIRTALADADLKPSDIGHINANATGSVEGDRDEALAIHDVFEDCASSVPVTALKSYIGNCGSGSGTIELAGSLLGLRQGVIPPTLNYQKSDSECPLNVVHGGPLKTDNPVVLNINITRSGQASTLIARAE